MRVGQKNSCAVAFFIFSVSVSAVWLGVCLSVGVVLPLPLTFRSYTQAGILTTELPTKN
jgi:hypothetical protein